MTRYYLGPHEPIRKDSFFTQTGKRLKHALATPRKVSFALVVVAGISFAMNFAFIGLSATSSIWGPKVRLAVSPAPGVTGSSTLEQGMGSDEGVDPSEKVSYYFVDDAPTHKAESEAFIVADADTGKIILEHNSTAVFPIASVTKIMTSMITKDNINPQMVATVSKSSYDTYGTEGGLGAGEKIIAGDLLYPLLIESSNDAAEVLAESFGRSAFMSLLNQKAVALNMKQTIFEDPSGLSPYNVSTASDLLRMGLHFRMYYPELFNITRVKEYVVPGHSWTNKNKFLTYPNFLGGKNGFTNEAKQSSVSFFTVFFRSDDADLPAKQRTVAVIILRSKDRDVDTAELLTHISKYARYTLSK